MSIPDYATLLRRMGAPTQVIDFCKSGDWAAGTNPNTTWLDGGNPATGVVPTTAIIPTNATVGSIGQANPAVGPLRAWARRQTLPVAGGAAGGYIMLVDRLAQIGGLSGTVTTAQTVSFPSLTRYTNGVGVLAAVEISTAVGATATTLTMNYTNQAGTSGQISQPIVFGGSLNNAARVTQPISLALGDSGVQAVASVTVLATTGTAGNFGITLYKPLAMWPSMSALPYVLGGSPLPEFGAMPVITNGACLQMLHGAGGTAATLIAVALEMFEE